MDSSSTSSPFSTRSTIPSSPENLGGENSATGHHPSLAATSSHLMQGMQALLSNLSGVSSYNALAGTDFAAGARPSSSSDAKLNNNHADPSKVNGNGDLKPAMPLHVAQMSRASTSAAPSTAGSHGGSRTEPPKRAYEVDGLALVTPSLDDIASTYPTRNRILLQGDPQVIRKQRVETAIRVIIDVLRLIPKSPSNPPTPPSLFPLLTDNSGKIVASFERLATFRGLRLQAGTTTKTSSKKQLAAGTIPPQQVAYVETAVYMSGENGKRVYACKRCRNREERRRQNKDAARKKQLTTEPDPTPPPTARPSLRPASEEYVTGENSHQYDPHRVGQVVEEPPWDPNVPDWRHEIVLFNSPPDVAVKEGSCCWLPFRVICYCKCHGEKVGFRIKFTLRTFDGRVIASDMTHPIKITDDHKTDAKAKPRVGAMSSTGASAPRARKGRMSTASSQRQSPVPSESEMSVTSEVGAVVQKQTPQVRQGKPYERPPSQSPAVGTSALPFDFMNNASERPRLSRQLSASSYASQQTDISSWTPDAIQQNTVSPDALRRPNFNGISMTPMSAQSSLAPSPAQTQHFPSLSANGMPANDIYSGDLGLSAHTPLDLSALGGGMPAMFGTETREDVDMNSMATDLENMLFGSSSHASVSSSFHDDHSSVFSGFQPGSSLFSESGLPPENSLDDMIDYSGGESTGALSPMQNLNLSPHVGMGQLDLAAQHQQQLQQQQHRQQQQHQQHFPQGNGLPQMNQNDPDAQTRALLALLAQQQANQNIPTVSHVIPAEGDMAGGTPVAIAGRNFAQDTVIMFGGRPAITAYVTDSFLQCTLPASPIAGDVEVSVQGAMSDPTAPAMLFKYLGMDKEIMRLMLEVRQRHQGSAPNDPAVRLVDHIARSSTTSDISDRSSMSPGGHLSSPFDAENISGAAQLSSSPDEMRIATPPPDSDLQTTLISFLENLDEANPGSLRRSGAVNTQNKAKQTLLHIATVMGFPQLLRRLIVVGAKLDVQDSNGFTPLAFAALCEQTTCARVLLEAGASYDIATTFGELPLDLAKIDEHNEVEAILLSSVWQTTVEDKADMDDDLMFESGSEIDDDNPSSESDNDDDHMSIVSRVLRPRHVRRRKPSKGKGRLLEKSRSNSPRAHPRRISPETTPALPMGPMPPHDDPPPYAPPQQPSWMSRTLSNISHPTAIPEAVWHTLPSLWPSEKASASAEGLPHGWVAFPAPSWDTLQKITSPEDIKLFTQAMAAAAFNAVVQSGATTASMDDSSSVARSPVKARVPRRRRSSGAESKASSRDLSASQVVAQVKQDRMLYLFWLPVLLFVGFWLLVTALPIATGFCLLYARQISRYIKQRI